MTEFAGQTVLITGAASGLGRQLARGAAGAGAAVVLWDINEQGMSAVARELRAESASWVHSRVVDVSDRTAVYTAAAALSAVYRPIDILINNAGIVTGRPLLEIPDDRIQATFAVNTLALYWTTKAFLPEMIRRGRGHIVTIASAAGLIGVARQSDYSASKHAAVGFDESLRSELRRTAPFVQTTVVCPYYIDTGMFAGVTSRFPLLLPILQEQKVADRVLRAIRRDERRVLMPPLVRLLPALRLLPAPLFDRVADLFGIHSGMDGFRGR
ncbi:MAG: SDR family oxidoreductase [Acidobacteria bacterium]|nr:SDR family oxidoreductase [Acidobacteriota bacterium]